MTYRPLHQQYIVKRSAGEPENPTTYCTNLGFVPPEPDGQVAPPIEIEVPTSEMILLLCSNEDAGFIRLYVQGAYTASIIDSTGTTIYTVNKASGSYFEYTFPTPTIQYFTVKIVPDGVGVHLTQFSIAYNTTYIQDRMHVLQAKFYTPYMVNLTSAFTGTIYLKEVLFYTAMDSLTSFQNFLSASNIGYFKFPSSLQSLILINGMFLSSKIITIDFNNTLMPSLTSMRDFTYNATNLANWRNMNIGTCAISSFENLLNGVTKLKSIDLSNIILTTSAQGWVSTRYMFASPSLEEVVLFDTAPGVQINVHCEYATINAFNLRKVVFKGNLFLNSYYFMYVGTISLKEVVAAPISKIETMFAWSYSNSIVETITLPSDTWEGYYGLDTGFDKLRQLIGEPTTYIGQKYIVITSPFIATFNYPTMPVLTIIVGVGGGTLNYVEVDWANSFNGYSYSVGSQLVRLYGSLSTAELNRIYTSLPTLTIAGKIYVSQNPGYAASDITIATVKNWTFG